MENNEFKQINDELLTALGKYPENSKEYQNIVAKIVKNNQGLVKSIAGKYCSLIGYTTPNSEPVFSEDDLIAEGYFGLLKAIKAFKSGKGATFSTYATLWIKSYILQQLKSERKKHNDASLEDTIITHKNGNERKLEENLATLVNLKEEFVEQDETNRKIAWVRENIDRLAPKQKEVITAKYLSEKASLKGDALADELECTRQYISTAEEKAITNLKKMYYAAHPEEIVAEKEKIELTSEEKIKLKEELKNLVLTKLAPTQKETMLCKYYSASKKTTQQVAQEINANPNTVKSNIDLACKKLCTLCDSVQDIKHLKNILKFRSEENRKER